MGWYCETFAQPDEKRLKEGKKEKYFLREKA
jgi:hypothetical protein